MIATVLTLLRKIARLPALVAIACLRAYKTFLSPLLPPACRFRPTCSEYCREAIERHGLFRGGWYGSLRVLRCNPFFRGGWDPVPGSDPGASAEPSKLHSPAQGSDENCGCRRPREEREETVSSPDDTRYPDATRAPDAQRSVAESRSNSALKKSDLPKSPPA